jgi:hypothetical protein
MGAARLDAVQREPIVFAGPGFLPPMDDCQNSVESKRLALLRLLM